MIRLSKEQVIGLHREIIEATGGIGGLINDSLLDAALSVPLQTFGSKELYPTTIDKIARTTYGIIKNHPFADGNKRTATFVMLILLRLNEVNTNLSNADVVFIGQSVANGTMNQQGIVSFIISKLLT